MVNRKFHLAKTGWYSDHPVFIWTRGLFVGFVKRLEIGEEEMIVVIVNP